MAYNYYYDELERLNLNESIKVKFISDSQATKFLDLNNGSIPQIIEFLKKLQTLTNKE